MKIDSHLLGGIDMGTTKVSALIGEATSLGVRVIGIGTTASDGLRQGVVVDIERATRAVMQALGDAERMAGSAAPFYNVGVAGEHIRSMNSRGVVEGPGAGREIGGDLVLRSLNAARNFSLPNDREILHTLPQQYIIDDQAGIREPSGMYGSRLEARVHVVTASRAALDNVVKVIELARRGVGELVLEPLASGESVLAEDERETGVMLIDIGGGTSDVMIFHDGGVMASGVIGIGGNNVTSDLAYGLRTSMAAAEQIKVSHGCALSTMVSNEEKVEVPGVGPRDVKQVGRQIIAAIIEPRMTELFSLINDQITKSELKESLGAGVVLTGGSSMLAGTAELAEQVFDMPVRIGTPIAVDGLTEVVSHPMYATGVGLLLYDDSSGLPRDERAYANTWWKQSFSQLRRAIASFI